MRRSHSKVQFFQIKAQTVLICIYFQQIFFTTRTDGRKVFGDYVIQSQKEKEREKLREKNENNTTITKKYAKQMNWG